MFKIKEKNKKVRFCRIYLNSSLLLVLAGSFLLPNLALSANITEKNIINLTNLERTKEGLEILDKNPLLREAAKQKALDIIENGIFSHTIDNNSFSKWIKDAGYEYSFIGENLAIDFISSESTIKAWLKSPSHKENLLNERFEEIGVAVLEGEFENNNTVLVVQIFGTPIVQTNKPLSKQNNYEEKLFVRFVDDNIINDKSSNIITETISSDYKVFLKSTNDTHPLALNSKTSEFYSILFAIIISSLIVSVMFPQGIKIKKPKIRAIKKLIIKKLYLKKDTKSHT